MATAPPARHVQLAVDDDDMAPTLVRGTVVVIDTHRPPEAGDVVLMRDTDGGIRLRRWVVQVTDAGLYHFQRDAAPGELVTFDFVANHRVLGTVVHVQPPPTEG